MGLGLIVGALAGAVVLAPFGVASAEETEQQPLAISKQAYWTRSLGYIAPPALTNHFPPTAVCLVAPDFCNSGLKPLLDAGDEQVVAHQPENTIAGGDQVGLLMAGGEDNLPASVIAGARRYLSAIQFDVPPVPADHKVSKFELKLTPVEELTFHFDSPGFRQAILAVLRGIQTEDPKAALTELQKIGTPPHQIENDVHLGVEACPIVGGVEWKGESNQNASSAPERDSDERSGTQFLAKQVDCNIGATGRIKDGTWVFDLTLAANAWAEGKLASNGVLLRPVLPPNVAYGDPDISTWDQVVFYSAESADSDAQKPAFTFATKEKAKPVNLGAARTFDSQVLGAQTDGETFTEVFGAMDEPSTPLDAPAPEVDPSSGRAPLVPALSGTPVNAWWTWLLLPMFLGGIYVTTQALTAEPVLVKTERAGAMTRLIEARRRGELI